MWYFVIHLVCIQVAVDLIRVVFRLLFIAVAQDTDVEVVTNVHPLGTAQGETLQDSVYRVGGSVHFVLPRLACQRSLHGVGLVN